MFPVEKYRYYVNEKKREVIAASTYAGHTVRGRAKCDPRDEFDIQKGKDLAAARCAAKIAEKRVARATKKVTFAQVQFDEAQEYLSRMNDYWFDARTEVEDAIKRLEALEASM